MHSVRMLQFNFSDTKQAKVISEAYLLKFITHGMMLTFPSPNQG